MFLIGAKIWLPSKKPVIGIDNKKQKPAMINTMLI